MKKLLLLFALLCASPLFAQISISVPNDTVTGTKQNKLAKYNTTASATSAIVAATTDTSGIVGIVSSPDSAVGTAVITISGVAPCIFDNATTPNDYVQTSSGTAGDCHDTGSSTRPTSGQIIGTVFGAGGAAGTYNVSLEKQIIPSAASANVSSLLSSQGPQAQVTGTGAAANVYTFSIPGNTMSTTSCIRATAFAHHSTGATSMPYSWNFAGTSFVFPSNAGAGETYSSVIVCNNGATNSQYISAPNINVGTTSLLGGITTAAVDTTTAQSISFQFNVASSDKVTPDAFVVESLH
jgi:hypothetical protein